MAKPNQATCYKFTSMILAEGSNVKNIIVMHVGDALNDLEIILKDLSAHQLVGGTD